MRITCNVHQALAPKAAAVLKQSVAVAKGRGHAQVTPLHVAATMLACPTSLLRKACLHSDSHPLQYKALEFCLNVALNRLPTSNPSPFALNPHASLPSLSNSLIAAFKRAQAQQRRGSLENNQHSVNLAVKIELEQLVISILDDPSVSRVMREAGFWSIQVKNKVEQAVSLEIQRGKNETRAKNQALDPEEVSQPVAYRNRMMKPALDRPLLDFSGVSEAVKSAVEALVSKRMNIAIVGESLARTELVVRGVADRFLKGHVSGSSMYFQFISLPIFRFKGLSKEEVEQKLLELRCLVRGEKGKRVILFLGDLKWVSEFLTNCCGDDHPRRTSPYYCPVEHLVMELRTMVAENLEEHERGISLMGISTFTTYKRLKTFQPSLETLWNLHPVMIAVDNLSLTLNLDSDPHTRYKSKDWCYSPMSEVESDRKPFSATSVPHHSKKDDDSTAQPVLPRWLRLYKEEQTDDPRGEKPELLPIPNSSPNSASSSEAMEEEPSNMFKEFTAENLNSLCDALGRKFPQHKEITIPEIASAFLRCRSGLTSRKILGEEVGEECWMAFLGPDSESKEKMARELAKLVFGSHNNFVLISSSEHDHKNKRKRPNGSYVERIGEALNENPDRVFFVEDFEQFDECSQKGIKQAIETGAITLPSGQSLSVPLKDAVIILNCESLSSAVSTTRSQEHMITSRISCSRVEDDNKEEKNQNQCVSLDLNIAIGDDRHSDGIEVLESVDALIFFKAPDP